MEEAVPLLGETPSENEDNSSNITNNGYDSISDQLIMDFSGR